jgi:hypothetical protein
MQKFLDTKLTQNQNNTITLRTKSNAPSSLIEFSPSNGYPSIKSKKDNSPRQQLQVLQPNQWGVNKYARVLKRLNIDKSGKSRSQLSDHNRAISRLDESGELPRVPLQRSFQLNTNAPVIKSVERKRVNDTSNKDLAVIQGYLNNEPLN